MGNCLKTQLKQSVNNDTLKKTNEVEIKVEGINNCYFGFNNIRTSSGVTANNKILTGSGKVFLSNENTSLVVYHTTSLQGKIWIKDFLYTVSPLININIEAVYLPEFSDINDAISTFGNVSTFRIHSCALTGELTQVSDNIEWLGINAQLNITGNIAVIGRYKNINKVNVSYTGITGTLEDFVAAQRDILNTTGSVVFENCAKTNLKYKNNESLPSGDHTLTWDATKQYLDGVEF